MYVITDAGRMIFKVARSKKGARMEAFGGSTGKPSNIVFALARPRRELADESSITITEDNLVRMSPLVVVHDGRGTAGLVQIVVIKQTWLDIQSLWVPKAARENWYSQGKGKDDTTGFWEQLSGHRGAELRDRLESKSGGWRIGSKRLEEVLKCRGDSCHRWRDCDFDTLLCSHESSNQRCDV